jgi:hypothetical protein
MQNAKQMLQAIRKLGEKQLPLTERDYAALTHEELELLDQVAAVTQQDDPTIDDLQRLFTTCEGLRLPTVFDSYSPANEHLVTITLR